MGSATDALMGKVRSATKALSGDGASFQTKKALKEVGEGMDDPATASPESAGIGGPSPSGDLLKRVEAERQRKAAESLKRVMENRRKGQ